MRISDWSSDVCSSELFFCEQKTACEMRISDWSSGVCSSDLKTGHAERANGCLGTAGDHHIGIVPHDDAGGIADGMCTGREGRHHSMVRALETVFDGAMADRKSVV